MGEMALRQRALSAAGRVARHVPIDQVQLFAFVASPKVRSEPWKLYQRLHQRGAVRQGPYGVHLVGSHAGVTKVLRDPHTSVQERLAEGLPRPEGPARPFEEFVSRTLLFTDAPEHSRLRGLVSRAFTPRRLEGLRSTVEAMAEERVAKLRPQGSADLLTELALPMPVDVICELLGVPSVERDRFLGWARHLAPAFDISLFRDETKERLGDEAAVGLSSFLAELIDDPSRREPNGLLSALVEVDDDGDRLTTDEIVALAALLLVAGFETTANLVVNGLVNLLAHPEQLARVRDGDVAPGTAVEELLRFEGPVQFTQRVPLADIELDGHVIPARRLVALLIGAANRDPNVFPEPDRLDVGRDPNPHLAFSSGTHFCLGATLARMEAAAVIPAVLRELPDLRLTAKPPHRDTFVLRGRTSLPVAWRT
jgi:cytochrome P450